MAEISFAFSLGQAGPGRPAGPDRPGEPGRGQAQAGPVGQGRRRGQTGPRPSCVGPVGQGQAVTGQGGQADWPGQAAPARSSPFHALRFPKSASERFSFSKSSPGGVDRAPADAG